MARILIVDDEEEMRRCMAGIMQRDGHETFVASSPIEAEAFLHSTRPDLIISDVCMEGSDGLSFLESVRHDPRSQTIPFIIITGLPDREGLLRGIENAADGYIPKPFTAKTLSSAVKSRLEREIASKRNAAEIRTQLFRVLEASPDLIAMAEPGSLNLFYLNPAGRRLLETEAEFARPLESFFPNAAAEEFRNSGGAAAARMEQEGVETILVSASGRRIPVHLVIQAHRRQDETLEYYSVIARDLTEQKASEARLRAKEHRFRCLVDALPEAVFINDDAGRISFCNARATQLLEHSTQELIGMTFRSLFGGQPPGCSPGGETEHLTRRQLPKEYTAFRKSGTPVAVSLVAKHLHLEGQKLELCIVHDLTDRKRMERERQEVEVQLRQAQKLESIGQLAAGIAHEINTPTQYIGDNVRFLKDAFQSVLAAVQQQERSSAGLGGSHSSASAGAARDPDLDYLLSEIPLAIDQSLEGVERVSKIVRAMKDFSHPNTAEKSFIDINHAIDSTLTVARNEWKYVANLEKSLCPDLPPVPCLPGEFNQVILNLVVNAAHAIAEVVRGTSEKGVIGVSTAIFGDWVEIRISDTGTGIPATIQNRIFEPFFTTKEVGKGTGQGLAIARAVIVEKHDGTIHFETEPGKGTTFIIRLPISGMGSEQS